MLLYIFFTMIYVYAQQVPLRPTEFRVAVFRLLYDVSFFIIIPIIGLNLVLGITVDTFSELREERVRAGSGE